MDGEWGDWIALWGLTNMLNIPVALVSSLGEAGLKIINPNVREEETLLGNEAEVHFHSLEQASDTANPKDVVSELKERYGEGKVNEEIGSNCGKKFLLSYMLNIFVYTIFTHENHAFELRIELPFYV